MKRKTFDDIYQSYIKDIFRYLFSLCHDYHLTEVESLPQAMGAGEPEAVARK